MTISERTEVIVGTVVLLKLLIYVIATTKMKKYDNVNVAFCNTSGLNIWTTVTYSKMTPSGNQNASFLENWQVATQQHL